MQILHQNLNYLKVIIPKRIWKSEHDNWTDNATSSVSIHDHVYH